MHKRCAPRAPDTCKWTSLSSVGKDIIEEDGVSVITCDEGRGTKILRKPFFKCYIYT